MRAVVAARRAAPAAFALAGIALAAGCSGGGGGGVSDAATPGGGEPSFRTRDDAGEAEPEDGAGREGEDDVAPAPDPEPEGDGADGGDGGPTGRRSVCAEASDGTPCEVPCFLTAACLAGACQPDATSFAPCPASFEACVLSYACEPKTGACSIPIFAPSGAPCDADGDPCTLDVCNGKGACAPTGGVEGCAAESAADACWSWSCAPGSGCAKAALVEGAPCDDGNPCTIGDVCAAGAPGGGGCAGAPLPVDDGNPCTADSCLGGAALHEPVDGAACPPPPGACSDVGICAGGACVAADACGCASDTECPDPADPCAGEATCDLSASPPACAIVPGSAKGSGKSNPCKGCTALASSPGAPCGACGGGVLQCAGTDALACTGAATKNVCGGCATLPGAPGAPCEGCDGGTWACAPDGESLVCEAEPAPPPGTCGAGGLVAWWRLDETSGPIADSSGCGGDGTSYGTKDDVCAVVRYGSRFDDDLDRIHVLDTAHLEDLPALTIEAWVFQETADFGAYVALGDGAGGDPWFFGSFLDRRLHAAFGFPPSCFGMGSFLDESGALVPLGTWTHAAVTVDLVKKTLTFYLDGKATGSHALPSILDAFCTAGTGEGLTLGNLGLGPSWGFIGILDEVKVWSTVRTPAQICADAGGVFGPPCDLSGVLP